MFLQEVQERLSKMCNPRTCSSNSSQQALLQAIQEQSSMMCSTRTCYSSSYRQVLKLADLVLQLGLCCHRKALCNSSVYPRCQVACYMPSSKTGYCRPLLFSYQHPMSRTSSGYLSLCRTRRRSRPWP